MINFRKLMAGASPVALAIVLTACSAQPVKSPAGGIPVGADGNHLEISEIGQAIADACRARKWTPSRVEIARVGCSITVRGRHRAVVDIEFDQSSYRINYRDSDLKERTMNPEDGI
jgi:hypothetical protein